MSSIFLSTAPQNWCLRGLIIYRARLVWQTSQPRSHFQFHWRFSIYHKGNLGLMSKSGALIPTSRICFTRFGSLGKPDIVTCPADRKPQGEVWREVVQRRHHFEPDLHVVGLHGYHHAKEGLGFQEVSQAPTPSCWGVFPFQI